MRSRSARSRRRALGVRGRLILSFLTITIAPVVVALVALGLSRLFVRPGEELVYSERVRASVTDAAMTRLKPILPGVQQVWNLESAGSTEEARVLLKKVRGQLEKSDTVDILDGDGNVLVLPAAWAAAPPDAFVSKAGIGATESVPSKADLPAPDAPIPPLPLGVSSLGKEWVQYVWELGETDGQATPAYGRLVFSVARLAFPVERTERSLPTVFPVLLGILSFVVLVLLLSWRLSRSILVPLKELAGATQAIAAGNLDVPVTYRRNDEFGGLSAAFDEMRARLRDSLIRLQRNDTDRRAMIAGISHDLRTPLTSIRAHAEGLRDGVAEEPDARERYTSVILEKARQMEVLIDGLARISRLELDDNAVTPVPQSSGALFSSIFERCRSDAETAGRSFVVEGEIPECAVHADASAMAQVVDNIIQNAIRYTPRGGEIRAGVSRRDDRLEVSISDAGPGIAAKDLPHVFEPFYRGDPARSSSQGEAGLGLAICKRIVERHGGTIRAENSGGALITFTLPLA